MSRSLSSTFLAALLAGQTDEVYHTLIVLSGSGISTKRYVNNYENVTSGGNVYTAAAFKAHPPHDVEDQIPGVNMVCDNADRTLIEDIRTVTNVPTVTLAWALQSTPSVIEVGPLEFKVRSVDYDKLRLNGFLQYQDVLNDNYLQTAYTPIKYPGLYA